LDRSATKMFERAVISKHFVTGQHASYYLHVGPWGPESSPSDLRVSGSLYRSIQPNQTVCIYLRSGALRIPWYVVRLCP
jgi:hypothetical protein